jgi:hypothetical protein
VFNIVMAIALAASVLMIFWQAAVFYSGTPSTSAANFFGANTQ